jgi:hypothetical protein
MVQFGVDQCHLGFAANRDEFVFVIDKLKVVDLVSPFAQ